MTSDNRKLKEKVVAQLTEKLSGVGSVAVIDYSGMDVASQQALKKALQEAGGEMLITKNTLFKIAATNANLPGDLLTEEILSGQNALVLSAESNSVHSDAVASIQALGKFIAKNEMPKMKAGMVEGTFADGVGMIKISKLPGREALYAQVVGAVAAPMYAMVSTMQAKMNELVYILNEASKGGGE